MKIVPFLEVEGEEEEDGDVGEEMVLQEEDLQSPSLTLGSVVLLSHNNNNSNDDDDAPTTSTTKELAAETEETTLDALVAAAAAHKEEGNALFATQKYKLARVAYQKGLDVLQAASSQTSSTNMKELQISLHSNLAMICLKINDYTASEQHCTTVIDQYYDHQDDHHGGGSLDVAAKVWYRRALAREELACNSTTTTSHYLDLAMSDLQRAIHILSQQAMGSAAMRNTAVQALERVQKKKRLLESSTTISTTTNVPMVISPSTTPEPTWNTTTTTTTGGSGERREDDEIMGVLGNGHNGHHTTGSSSNGTSTATTTTTIVEPPEQEEPMIIRPEPSQQREDIMRLLISRSVSLQKKQSSSSSSQYYFPTVGEAFFLVDWKWWCQWCRHVEFYPTDDTADRVLKLLPPGAILPPAPAAPAKDKDNNNKDDDDSSSGSSSSSSDNDEILNTLPPGKIDNTGLLLPTNEFRPQTDNHNSQTQPSFYRQWYRHFQPLSEDSEVRLRPNLVRGYHFEILPREVYCALKTWYREVTPSICRRTKLAGVSTDGEGTSDQNGKRQPPQVFLELYPLMADPPPPPGKTTTTNNNNNNSYQACGACRAQYASKRCTRCMTVSYCDRGCQESHWPFHKAHCSKTAAAANGGESDHYVADGRVGLHQLGNTCFMNAALQCLSHATPLTRHFLSNQFKIDLNDSNPLGTGGKLALSFEAVLKELWMKPNITSTTPTALKRAIALFAPRFAGCLQHDSQEFLAYLLDGLHEDLNRIKKPPYVEMPDAGHHGANMAVAGAEAWECHKLRNDSLVLDTFYGQFKSTCVCPNPNCGRVSVSFDAFNHVSLEIPQMQNSTLWISIMVFYNPPVSTHTSNAAKSAKSNPRVVRYAICVRRGSLIVDLKQALSQVCGIPTTHLVMCEVSDHTIVEILNDNRPVASIRPDDSITAYQVDPYTNSTIHAVVTNALVEPGIKTGEDGEEEPKINPDYRQLFGYPFLTSCDANLTCRQLMDHLWRCIRRMVTPLTESGDEEDIDPELEKVYRQLFRARITDAEGNSEAVFPSTVNYGHAADKTTEETEEAAPPPLSPYVPADLDEKISKFVGEDCTTKFLFVNLEWKESLVVPQELVKKAAAAATASSKTTGGNNKKKKKTKKTVKEIPKVIRIEEQRFYAFVDHPSFMEGVKKQRAMNAAKGVSLDQCFETFTKPERLDEHNKYYCSNCKEHVRALKTMALWRLPNVLVVHLKRFEYRNSFRREKLSTFVDFPLEGLDMSQHCAKWSNENDESGLPEELKIDDEIPAVYDLFGVVNHYGRMGFGHYTAFARKWDEQEISKDWALFDDSSVRSVGDGRGGSSGVDSVASPAAYVLFYKRRAFN